MLRSIILSKNLSLLFVYETKMFATEFNYRFQFTSCLHRFVVDYNARRGGFVLFWNAKLNINVVSYLLSHIEIIVFDSSINRLGVLLGFMAPRSPHSFFNHGNLFMIYVI